ncbi:hypothetical protein D3218_05890 [Aureimonas flava]|uniref:Uncharacterized protein n=1 Tax=Aureimonas flava TaxID=2320271 RepID=A0A3A1WKM3_9HYPH|nr:hypothetical protein [Aureimonas flava]RIY01859.1 hypothetical protein D3218_05890 [Aureimonas flava]
MSERSAANLLLLVAGLVIWSSAFVSLYALLSVGCAFGWEARSVGPVSVQRAVLLGVWLLHLAALAALVGWTWRRARRAAPSDPLAGFFARTALACAVVSVAVTLVNYAPILGLSACL